MKTLLRFSILVLMLAAASPAFSQQQDCGPHSLYVRHLFDNYDEISIGRGINFGGVMMELLVSDTGSWTLLAIQPNRLACMVASGEGWDDTPAPPPSPNRGEIEA